VDPSQVAAVQSGEQEVVLALVGARSRDRGEREAGNGTERCLWDFGVPTMIRSPTCTAFCRTSNRRRKLLRIMILCFVLDGAGFGFESHLTELAASPEGMGRGPDVRV
jgi:hypothetical protein